MLKYSKITVWFIFDHSSKITDQLDPWVYQSALPLFEGMFQNISYKINTKISEVIFKYQGLVRVEFSSFAFFLSQCIYYAKCYSWRTCKYSRRLGRPSYLKLANINLALLHSADSCHLFLRKNQPQTKIKQTEMIVRCQRFGNLFLFGLVWQYSLVQTTCNKGRFKVVATYLQQRYELSLPSNTDSALKRELNFCNGYLSLLYFCPQTFLSLHQWLNKTE